MLATPRFAPSSQLGPLLPSTRRSSCRSPAAFLSAPCLCMAHARMPYPPSGPAPRPPRGRPNRPGASHRLVPVSARAAAPLAAPAAGQAHRSTGIWHTTTPPSPVRGAKCAGLHEPAISRRGGGNKHRGQTRSNSVKLCALRRAALLSWGRAGAAPLAGALGAGLGDRQWGGGRGAALGAPRVARAAPGLPRRGLSLWLSWARQRQLRGPPARGAGARAHGGPQTRAGRVWRVRACTAGAGHMRRGLRGPRCGARCGRSGFFGAPGSVLGASLWRGPAVRGEQGSPRWVWGDARAQRGRHVPLRGPGAGPGPAGRARELIGSKEPVRGVRRPSVASRGAARGGQGARAAAGMRALVRAGRAALGHRPAAAAAGRCERGESEEGGRCRGGVVYMQVGRWRRREGPEGATARQKMGVQGAEKAGRARARAATACSAGTARCRCCA
jgi:hypothetical protein